MSAGGFANKCTLNLKLAVRYVVFVLHKEILREYIRYKVIIKNNGSLLLHLNAY